jgi:hypothetical protein
MFNLHFDPVTTQLVIGKKKKSGTGGGSGGGIATMSALYVVNDLELQINTVIVKDYIEVAEDGTFTVFDASTVEIS